MIEPLKEMSDSRRVIMKTLDIIDGALDARVIKQEIEKADADTTRTLVHASLIALADMEDENVDGSDQMTAFVYAYANAICTICGTVATRHNTEPARILGTFLNEMAKVALRLVAQGGVIVKDTK